MGKRTNHGERKTKDSILIADDDIGSRTAIAFLFEDAGFMVSQANSGEEALSMITEGENEYDLVIVDLEMPQMSGFKLVKELKRDHADIHVFAVSGFQDKVMIMEMLNTNCKKVFAGMVNNGKKKEVHKTNSLR